MSRSSGLDAILLVDKPSGWTSHDVVARARRLTGQRRIGHTGTLDPMATGLLVLCLGTATRLVEYMCGHDKRYEGEVLLGATTNTDDADGEVTSTRPVPALSAGLLADVEGSFTGVLQQVPPGFSAVKVDGRRAYAMARSGDAPVLKPRTVTVHSLHLEAIAADRLALSVHCGAGTYVRSLARDMGEQLGCGAHLARLRRTSVGGFSIDDAVSLSELELAVAQDRLGELLLPPDDGIAGHPVAILAGASASAFQNGITLTRPLLAPSTPSAVRVYTTSGLFSGIGRVEGSGELRPLKVFKSAD